MKLLEGYVENRTKEVALAATFATLYVVTRQFKILVFPTVFIRICGFFAYIPATFLPWGFTLIIPMIVAFTSEEPVGSFFALLFGIQVAYFSSRLLKRYRMLTFLLATYTANLTAMTVRMLMGLIPLYAGVPLYLFRATITGLGCLVLAPPVWKVLETAGAVDFSREEK